jgi:apolipoprotein N-acyltransferase
MKNLNTSRKLYDLPVEILLTLLSAVIYSLAFPSYISDTGFPIFATFALIPMIVAINRTKWVYSPLLGIIWGASFLSIFNYWLSTFHPYAILLAPVLRSMQLIVLMPIFKMGYHLPKKHKVLFQASLYTLYTYLMQIGFLGYPYGNLSSAFAPWLPLIQLSSVTGEWAVSFIMMIPQIFIANYFVRRTKGQFFEYLQENDIYIILYAMLMFINLVFGFSTIQYYDRIKPSDEIKIATIQHNSDTWIGGYTQYKKNFITMRDLTEEAMKENPDMVTWSETAFVPSVEWHTNYPSSQLTSKLVEDFVNFGKSLPVPLVTGNPEGVLSEGASEAFDEDGNWNRDDYNSVILFANGKLLDSYRKQHLVPFTEYFPYGNIFPKFNEFLKSNDFHFWLPGTESKIFEYKGLNFSTSICFEDIFPFISREFALQGSSLFLNLSNDSWSRAVSAERQHLNLGVYRSIENRRSTVKSTNSGITCLILPTGEVVDPMEPFIADYNIYSAPIYTEEDFGLSFYTRYGDWMIYLFYLIDITYIAYRLVNGMLLKKKKNKTK